VLGHHANTNQEKFGVGRRYYLPSAADMLQVACLNLINTTNPENPNWLAIKVRLTEKGRTELARLTPPEILAMLGTPATVLAPPTARTKATPDPFYALRALVKTLRLKGNEADTVLAICDANGAVPIANLAFQFTWDSPADNWNSTRKRLNDKVAKHGWRFSTSDGSATVEQIPIGRK